ncbi:hypothetical protein BCR44DRAFT_1498195 [Catenaria anguillulae PL171]|uniref:Protein SMG7 n=1 Tax=Catenaria anguillulae PL171 TaxID=765915 RepID=A0A1Y2HRU2_9FUNG|nr:hypothetical protein BCR44DRAFT_1498195 [Catenaria anguillulae PL171]
MAEPSSSESPLHLPPPLPSSMARTPVPVAPALPLPTAPLVQLYRGPGQASSPAGPSPSGPASTLPISATQAPLPLPPPRNQTQPHPSPIRHHRPAQQHNQLQHPRSSPNRVNPAANGNAPPRTSNNKPSRQGSGQGQGHGHGPGSSSGSARNMNRSGSSNRSTPNRSRSRGSSHEATNRALSSTRTPAIHSTSPQQHSQIHPRESVLSEHRRAVNRGDLFSPRVALLRQEIIMHHVTSILSNPHHGLASDLEHLWRHAMYCVVDAYRKQTRVAAKAGSRNGPTHPRPTPHEPHLFDSFVSQSMGVLHHLISQLTARYALPPAIFDLHHVHSPLASPALLSSTAHRPPSSDPTGTSTAAALLVFRSLIYLGDLARYRDQSTFASLSPPTPTLAQSVHYYQRAHTIVPDNGNPNNQLAIVALSSGKHVAALDMYLRALLARVAFPTARGNLALAALAIGKHAQGSADSLHEHASVVAVKPVALMLLGRVRDVDLDTGHVSAWARRAVQDQDASTLTTLVLGLRGVHAIGIVARDEAKVAPQEAAANKDAAVQVASVYLNALVTAMAEAGKQAVGSIGDGDHEQIVDRVLPALRMALIWDMSARDQPDDIKWPAALVDLMHAIEGSSLVASMLGIESPTGPSSSAVADMLAVIPPVALPEDLDELVGLVPFAAHLAAVLPELDESPPLGNMGFRSLDAIVALQAKVAAAKGLQADVVRAGRMMAVWQAISAKVRQADLEASPLAGETKGSRNSSPTRPPMPVQAPPTPSPTTAMRKASVASTASSMSSMSPYQATAAKNGQQLLQAPTPQQQTAQQRRGSGTSNRRNERGGGRGGRGGAAQRGISNNTSPRHPPVRLGSPGIYYGSPLDPPHAYAGMVTQPHSAPVHHTSRGDFLDEDDEFDPTPRQDRLPSAMPALVAVATAASSKSPDTRTGQHQSTRSPARDQRQHEWDSLDDEFDPTLPAISASLRALALDAEDERAAGASQSPGRNTDDVSAYFSTSLNGSGSFGTGPWGPTSPAAAVGAWPMSPPGNSAYGVHSPHQYETFVDAGIPPRSAGTVAATSPYPSTSANPWASTLQYQQHPQSLTSPTTSAPPTAASILSLNAAATASDTPYFDVSSPLPTPFADTKPSVSTTSSSRRPSLLPPPGPYADQLWAAPTSPPVPTNHATYVPPPGFAAFAGLPLPPSRPSPMGTWAPSPSAFQLGGTQLEGNPYLTATGAAVYGASGLGGMHEQQQQQQQHVGYSQLVHMIQMGNGAGASKSG